MLQHQLHDGLVSLLVGPVALVFQQYLLPGHRNGPGLDHPLHGHVMGLLRGATRSVGDNIDLESFLHRFQCRKGQTNLGPERRHYQLLAPGGLDRCYQVPVAPGVHRSALDRLLTREYAQDLGPDIATETGGFDGGENRWHVEQFSGLGQRNVVVLQLLAVDRLHAKGHLRLVVNQDQSAIVRIEQFANRHDKFLESGMRKPAQIATWLRASLLLLIQLNNYLEWGLIDSVLGTVMDRIDCMRTFVATVRHNGFAAAARALDMPRSRVSKQIQALEDGIGVQLLLRTTRSLHLTEAGAEYFDAAREVLASLDE